MQRNIYSIPNLLSFLRLGLVPVLVGLAYTSKPMVFLWVLAVALLSDVLDGYLARKLNQASELGARLDSWGDVLTYGCMIFGLHQLWPEIFTAQADYLLAAVVFFTLPVAIALSKFGSYPSYHTWGAKLAALLIAPAYYLLILGDSDSFFRMVIIFNALVAAEEVVITLILSRPRSNVDSVFSLLGRLEK